MANVPSASVPGVPVATSTTLAPPPVIRTDAPPPPEMTLEQWTQQGQIAATKLPKCTIPIECGTPGVNDERAYTRAAPVNCPTCFWWLPVGTIVTAIRGFKAYWHVSQLGDLKTPITQTISDAVVPLSARGFVTEAWRHASKVDFDGEATRTPGDAPWGLVPTVTSGGRTGSVAMTPRRGRDVSLNRFMEARRDFVLSYLDQTIPITPTQAELTEEGGTGRFKDRGGFLLSKPRLEGVKSIKNTSLWACAEWCAGCPNPTLYPGGTPTCVTSIKVETENFDWGQFVKRIPGGYQVSISRLPKSTWDKIEDGIRNVTDQLDKFEVWMCNTYNGPAGQIAVSQGTSSPDPQTQIATRAANYILQNGCAPRPSTGTQTTYNPASPPKLPWKAQTAQSAGNTFYPSQGTLAPPSSKRSVDMKIVFGLTALGLAAAGGASLIRKRKRKS